jgi:chemotaxis protein methyltransferase CheR
MPFPPSADSRPITGENFRFVCELAMREASIVLSEGKEYLVESRLAEVASRNRYASVNALVDHLRLCTFRSPALMESVDALTTNETLFFRDFHPFESLRKEVLPQLFAKQKEGRLVIWSAACSSGQEPYSLAMLLQENFPADAARIQILATDLSPTMIQRSKRGIYQQLEVNRGLPASYLVKYFAQTPAGWQVSMDLRRRIDFRELNLARPWSMMPRCDIVLIRNVMIYFDLPTRQQILRQIRELLNPGGYLILGGAETTMMIDDAFVPVSVGRSTFYQNPVKTA